MDGLYQLSLRLCLVKRRAIHRITLKEIKALPKKGDFLPASWGNSLVDLLQPADLVVEKVAYSAFYQTGWSLPIACWD